MPAEFHPKTADQLLLVAELLRQSAEGLTVVAKAMKDGSMPEILLNWTRAREKYIQSAGEIGSHASTELVTQLYAHKAGLPNPRVETKAKSARDAALRRKRAKASAKKSAGRG